MLELKEYTKPEMSEILGTKSVTNIKNKLKRYDVDFEVSGRGEKALFTI